MLRSVEFDPATSADTDKIMQAHVLLSDARQINPKASLDAARTDLERFKMFTHGMTDRPTGFRFYLDESDDVAGMTYTTDFSGPSMRMLNALAVSAERRGQGLGGEILDDTIEEAYRRGLGSVCLDVHRQNETAQRLYASRGFVVTDDDGSYLPMQLDLN